MLPAEAPAGAILLQSNARVRRQFMFAAAGGLIAFAAVAFAVILLFGPALATSAAAALIFLVLAASLPFAIMSWMAYRRRDAVVDIEIAPGRVRLPFRKHPERQGWRNVAEVHLLAQHATAEAKQAALEIVTKLRAPKREQPWNEQAVKFWTQGRSLLAITDDEVVLLRGETGVFDRLIAHWDSEKRRVLAGLAAPAASGEGGP